MYKNISKGEYVVSKKKDKEEGIKEEWHGLQKTREGIKFMNWATKNILPNYSVTELSNDEIWEMYDNAMAKEESEANKNTSSSPSQDLDLG